MSDEKKGLSGSALKLIAIVSMLIDHIGATVVERWVSSNPANFNEMGRVAATPAVIFLFVLRGIGRIAFPLFAFFVTEGFLHTRNKTKYLLRLCAFALISEIPFDMAFELKGSQIKSGVFLEFTYQNVFFTLALGLGAIWLLDFIRQTKLEQILKWILEFGTLALFMALAYALQTDYGCWGVLVIVVGYALRNKPKEIRMLCMMIPMAIMNLLEAVAFVDVYIISLYNGERGKSRKWFFYVFYPAHLLVLALICLAAGL